MFFFLILYAGSQRESVNRRRPRNNSGTKSAYAYKIYLVTSSGNMLVYKKFFMNIFQISSGRTDRILKSHENIPKNMSGKKNYELLANTVIQPT